MRTKCRRILGIIARNWSTLLYFEMIYKACGFIIVFPFIQYLLSFLPGFAGAGYLALDNVGKLFQSLPGVLLVLCILVLTAMYVAFELTALMLFCERGWHYEKLSLPGLLRLSAVRTAGLLKPGRIGVFVMLPVLMLSVFSPVSIYLKKVRIPEFIVDFIRGDLFLRVLYLAVLAVFHVILLLYLFGFPSILFSGAGFAGSWRESLRLLRGRKWRAIRDITVLLAVFLFLFFCVTALITFALAIWSKLYDRGENGRLALKLLLTNWMRVFDIAGGALAAVFLCGAVVVLYHECRGEAFSGSWKDGKGAGKRHVLRRFLVQTVNAVVLLYLFLLISESDLGGAIFTEWEDKPAVIAHRAGAARAPENTLAALEASIESGADAAEIDIQQLGDGTLIVLHDTNFKRTTGVDLDVWDADREMIRKLNAGAYFYREASREAVPTLEEFLVRAKGRIRLMIDLKSTGHEKQMEENVLRLVREHDMQDQCVIASMDLNILRRVRELEPELETVYISAILITSRYDLGFVDGYSVETTSLSPAMALQAHFQGKKVYGWTANSEYTVKRLIQCGVDGLITDDTRYAAFFAERYGENMLVNDIVGIFYP